MSDSNDSSRPSKRQRRGSPSSPPPGEYRRTERRNERRQADKSPGAEERKRRRSQDRDYTSRGKNSRWSASPELEQEERPRKNYRRRSQSRDGGRDRNREYARDHEREREKSSRHYRDDRSKSPRSDRHRRREGDRSRYRDRSRDRNHGRRPRSQSPAEPLRRSKVPLPSQNDAFTATTDPSSSALDKPVEKQKPNFGLTGKLAAASNTIQTANQTIVLKYHEPPEARKPPVRDQWRLYVFKDDEILETVELSEQSCWLIGREVAVADFPIEHPSCSKQHAVIQFRYLEKRNEFGDKIGKVKPYVIDLESANGTKLNEDPIPAAKYVELRDKDVLQFGHSSREYMIQLPPSARDEKKP